MNTASMPAHLPSQSAKALDAADPLRQCREAFILPPGVIYLDGNSLGARPKGALEIAQRVIEQEWGQDLIRSWNTAGWFDLPSRLGNKLAQLIGAADNEVVITDTISINLFKVLAGALRMRPGRKVIVSERENFPTDLYMAQGLAQLLEQGHQLVLIDSHDELAQVLNDEVAVVMLTHVNYRSGAMWDMAGATAAVQACGALMLWDLAHSAGAVEVDLNGANADFAVGCTYKYLNGGPGSPAFVFVASRWIADLQQPLSGWWGHAAPFVFDPQYRPAPDIRRTLCGTQGIVSMAMIEPGLDLMLQATMPALRKKSLALTSRFIEQVESRCAGLGLGLVTPREAALRGSQVSFVHEHGYAVMQALIARGVIGDYREPGILRFGFAPLYVRFQDVDAAADALREILAGSLWDRPEFTTRNAVT
jgi:kynureninase